MSPLSKRDAPGNRGVVPLPTVTVNPTLDVSARTVAAKVDKQEDKNLAENETKSTSEARKDIADAGAGVPDTMDAAAEALPEKDAVQKAYKKQATADNVKDEVAAKVTIVKESPDADETPSGGALLAVAGESDPIKQGEKYAREKAARRFGYVPADEK